MTKSIIWTGIVRRIDVVMESKNKLSFSQRIGKTPIKALQIDSMDTQLRMRLWNSIKIYIFDQIPKRDFWDTTFSTFDSFFQNLYERLGQDIDFSGLDEHSKEQKFKEFFFTREWFEVYAIVQTLIEILREKPNPYIENFVNACNNALVLESSAYRIISDLVSPITNQHEISEIEDAINLVGNISSLQGANIHLREALKMLSDRESPDYRNSIKESISAVESVVQILGGTKKELGASLDQIKQKKIIEINPTLLEGFKKLYGYTSDSDGIRHALQNDPTCDFEDAKYMLVTCSAFVNYLIVKADKAGIELK